MTVTQRATGAIAQGNETFEEGAATAVAVGRSTARGGTSDAHQWLVEVTLVED